MDATKLINFARGNPATTVDPCLIPLTGIRQRSGRRAFLNWSHDSRVNITVSGGLPTLDCMLLQWLRSASSFFDVDSSSQILPSSAGHQRDTCKRSNGHDCIDFGGFTVSVLSQGQIMATPAKSVCLIERVFERVFVCWCVSWPRCSQIRAPISFFFLLLLSVGGSVGRRWAGASLAFAAFCLLLRLLAVVCRSFAFPHSQLPG